MFEKRNINTNILKLFQTACGTGSGGFPDDIDNDCDGYFDEESDDGIGYYTMKHETST